MKTECEVERYCQEGPESLEHQGGMGQWQGIMKRSLQGPLPPHRETAAKYEEKVRRAETIP